MRLFWGCDCIADAFDMEHGEFYTEMRRGMRRHVQGCVDEYGIPYDRPGGRNICCACCMPGCDGKPGYYVPQCPWREHAVSGELRGDDMYEIRGEVRGAWRKEVVF